MAYYSKLLTLCALIVLSIPLSARILLDEVMTKEDQRQTGVSTLSYKQKMQLETWLNTHCIIKTDSMSPPNSSTGADLTISLNIQGGRQLQLSDNSLWEIAPNDVPNASFWILPIPIKISPSNDPNYPFLLTNQTTGISVRAKKISDGTPRPLDQ